MERRTQDRDRQPQPADDEPTEPVEAPAQTRDEAEPGEEPERDPYPG